MLEDAVAMAALPAQDLQRARDWYKEKLGLEPAELIEDDTGCKYSLATSSFLLFESSGAASGTHTQMSFTVNDVDAVAAWLRDRGVVFETYEGLDQIDGIADMGPMRGGWFKDSEGNLIGLVQELA